MEFAMEDETWFEWDSRPLSNAENAFLEALRDRARAWTRFDVVPEEAIAYELEDNSETEATLVVSLDLVDPETDLAMRSLRADFFEGGVFIGWDPTGQFGGVLHPNQPGITPVYSESPSELANAVADWFETQQCRRIERHEWMVPGGRHRRWKYADEDTHFLWSDPTNTKRRFRR